MISGTPSKPGWLYSRFFMSDPSCNFKEYKPKIIEDKIESVFEGIKMTKSGLRSK